MFSKQKGLLRQALKEHERNVISRNSAQCRFRQCRQDFISNPSNLVYPFVAGVLVTASQLKNTPEGMNRLPFMNLAKASIGLYAMATKVKNIRQQNMNLEKQNSANQVASSK